MLSAVPLLVVCFAGGSSTAASIADVSGMQDIDAKYEHVARLAWEAPTRSIELADQVLATDVSPLWRGRFENIAGVALVQSGHAALAEQRLARALAAFQSGGHSMQVGQIHLNLGVKALESGEFAKGLHHLVEAERASISAGHRVMNAWVDFTLANAHIEAATSSDDFEAARVYLFRGIEKLGPEDTELAQGKLRLGPPPRAPRALEKWRQQELDLDARYLAYEHLATLAFLEGDAGSALRWLVVLQRVANALGKPIKKLTVENLRASVLIIDGQVREGIALFDRTFEELQARGVRRALTAAAAHGARAHLLAGFEDRALELASSVLPPIDGSNIPTRLARETLLQIYKRRGRPSKALEHSEALNTLLVSFASENGKLIRGTYAAQQRNKQAELEGRVQQTMLVASGLALALLLISSVLLLRWGQRSANDARASKTVGALQKTINRELRHRFGNHLATLRAAANSDRAEKPTRRLERMRQSIEAMSALDAVVTSADVNADSVDLGIYLETLLSLTEEIYAPSGAFGWTVEAQPVQLDHKRTFLVGLAVAESVSNAFRHGFGQLADGHVRVSVRQDRNQIVVATEDDGVGMRRSSRRDGGTTRQGLAILQEMTGYLSGSLELQSVAHDTHRPGVRVTLRFPSSSKGETEPSQQPPSQLPLHPAISRGW